MHLPAFYSRNIKKLALPAFFIGGLFSAASAQMADSVFTVGTPAAGNLMKLQVDAGFLVRGNYNGAAAGIFPAASGPGTRLMWYPQRAAFRAGAVSGLQWDDANIGNYSFAAGYNVRAGAQGAVALGYNCYAAQVSSFAVGENNTASGACSVAMGTNAHTNARQGSFVFADRSTTDSMRAGANHTATWRTTGGFRIYTTTDLSTGITVQSGAAISNWGQTGAMISTSSGAMLTTAGVWQNSSDINKKHLFKDISAEEILQKLNSIAIREWSYKSEPSGIRHIGPMAQDFSKAFALGTDERSIGTVDADGVALACIQALSKRTEDQAKELDMLKSSNKELLERIDKLEQRLTGK